MILSNRPIRIFAVATVPLGLALVMTASPGSLAAQTLPTAEELIARYVEAIGGREAVLAPQATRASGTFEIPAQGLKGELVTVTQAPNRMVTKITIPGMEEILRGYDGQTGWSIEPMAGARIVTGEELDAMRENANALAAVRDVSLFRSVQTVERTAIAGEPCYRVRLVWRSGRETYDCFHVDTSLLIATSAEAMSPLGRMTVTTRLTDYRKFGGDVLIPTRTIIDMMGAWQVLTISRIEYENVDTSVIDPPARIRALIPAGQRDDALQ